MLRCPSFSTNNIPCTNGDPTGSLKQLLLKTQPLGLFIPFFCQHLIMIHILSIGIGKCEPLNFCWKGYNSSCCTSGAPCGYRQGGCSTNNQCSGQLICGTNDCGSGFDTTNLGQKCCHYPGKNTGTNVLSGNNVYCLIYRSSKNYQS